MPSDRTLFYLEDMKTYAEKSIAFIGSMSLAEFESDARTVLAVTRCLEIIFEASRKLADETLLRHPSIPWKAIKAAGNIYRHEYGTVSEERLYLTVIDELPRLVAVIDAEIDFLSQKPG